MEQLKVEAHSGTLFSLAGDVSLRKEVTGEELDCCGAAHTYLSEAQAEKI